VITADGDENEGLINQIEELLDALEDVVNQACSTQQFRSHLGDNVGTDDWELDSMALSAYAHGLRTLAKHGRVKIEQQAGRRVIASWIKQEESS
jgi:hypothetical protein